MPIRRRLTASVPIYYPDWPVVHELAADVARMLQTYAGATLLDIGCGEKPYKTCAPQVSRWIGLDADEQNTTADIHGIASAIPVAGDSFDTVLCTQVLEHVPDPAQVLHEIARVLRSGGFVIVSVPQYWPVHEEPYDYFRYTKIGISKLMSEAGFTVVSTTSQGRGAMVAGQALNNAILCAGDTFAVSNALWFKAMKAPLYLMSNVVFSGLARVLKTERDVLNHVLVGRLDR